MNTEYLSGRESAAVLVELSSGTPCERAAHEHYVQAGQYLANLGMEHLGPIPCRLDMARDSMGALLRKPFSALGAMRHIGLAQEQLRINQTLIK